MWIIFMLIAMDWCKYGKDLCNTHFQEGMGKMDTVVVKWSYLTGMALGGYGAAVADLDDDNKYEIIFGSCDGNLYALNSDGTLKWTYSTGKWIYSAPAVADIDNDGKVEVVFGCWDSCVHCVNYDSTFKWKYPTNSVIYSSPALVDLDKDGKMEVLIGSHDGYLHCINYNGDYRWSYKIEGGVIYSAPAVADIDRDDTLEIVFGGYNSIIYVLKANGTLKWKYSTLWSIEASPVLADIDLDGYDEVIITSYDSNVWVLRCNGDLWWKRWTSDGYKIYSSPAVANIDDDPELELVFGSSDSIVYAFEPTGGPPKWTRKLQGEIRRTPAIADINGDGKNEIIVSTYNGKSVYCLENTIGWILWKKDLAQNVNDPVIADIDNDGCLEIVVGTSGDCKLYVLDDKHATSNCSGGIEEENNSSTGSAWGEWAFMPILKEIKVFINEPGYTKIVLYDLAGRSKASLFNGYMDKGRHTIKIPNVTSGMYFVRLTHNNYKTILKIVILK